MGDERHYESYNIWYTSDGLDWHKQLEKSSGNTFTPSLNGVNEDKILNAIVFNNSVYLFVKKKYEVYV